VEDMGRVAVDLLRDVIDGGSPASVRLPSELIVRASSATPIRPHRPAAPQRPVDQQQPEH
jgi:LacI family transcriptional regulator